jgi:hypothetical protein
MRSIMSMALSVFCLFSVVCGPAKAETTVFESGFFFITESQVPVFDDIYVGQGAVVALIGNILVTGDIEVAEGAWLSTSGIAVLGDVEFDGATIVDLSNTRVGGDVKVSNTDGAPIFGLLPLVSLMSNTIDGHLKVTDNNVNSISITNNVVGKNIQIRRNVALITNIGNNTSHAKNGSK